MLSDTEAENDHGFEIGLPDIPIGQDLYDEQIPELGSMYEASSVATKPMFLKTS